MLRKLIMLAITSGIAKKLYDNYRHKQLRTPFPTSGRPMERGGGAPGSTGGTTQPRGRW
jgi:hypothetical protein